MLMEIKQGDGFTLLRPRTNILKIKPASVDSKWKFKDYLGAFLVRVSSYRNNYTTPTGLFKIGNPDKTSQVVVSANYKLSFDILRKSLAGLDLWILVLDTKGVNVWCAAGKGTFGTRELIKKIQESNLELFIEHKHLILPQLAGPGVNAHEVKKVTGFKVFYGPVEARDIPEYLKAKKVATPQMRKIEFSAWNRLVLTPMEFIPLFKYLVYYIIFIAFLFGLKAEGIIFKDIILYGYPYILSGFMALVSGSILTPVLLPIIPSRYFFIKGWIMGFIVQISLLASFQNKNQELYFYSGNFENLPFLILSFILFPLFSSFAALQFTGSTTFTNMTGVYKEHKYAIPLYKSGAAISFILIVLHKLLLWR